MTEDPTDRTLQTYEQAAQRYRELSDREPVAPSLSAFVDAVVEHVPAGASVLEIGSGPGRGARMLEERGLRVRRTDAAEAFVRMLREDGHPADVLDVRTDALGGPYELVFADAVFLHLSADDLGAVLVRLRDAVHDEGVLAFSVKQGVGAGWSTERLGLPRWFTYWQEHELRELLGRSGWEPLVILHEDSPRASWLSAVCVLDEDEAC